MVKRIYNLKIERLHSSKITLMKLPINPKLPSLVDLRSKMPPVYDQGNLGSCTSNALCALVNYCDNGYVGSRLFLYYNERVLENTISWDSGATLYDGIKSLGTTGICPEIQWPYNISLYSTKPPAICYTDALKEKALKVQNTISF